MSYAIEYRRSIDDPEGFWREQVGAIEWFDFPKTILDQDPNGASRWFRGGKLNSCWLALDHHVERGRGDQTALIYDSPVTGTVRKYSLSLIHISEPTRLLSIS